MFQTGCKNPTCVSDLSLDMFLADEEHSPYVIGSTKLLKLAFIGWSSRSIHPPQWPMPTRHITSPPTSPKWCWPSPSEPQPPTLPRLLAVAKDLPGCQASTGEEEERRVVCLLPGPLLPGDTRRCSSSSSSSSLSSPRLTVELDASQLYGGLSNLTFSAEVGGGGCVEGSVPPGAQREHRHQHEGQLQAAGQGGPSYHQTYKPFHTTIPCTILSTLQPYTMTAISDHQCDPLHSETGHGSRH